MTGVQTCALPILTKKRKLIFAKSAIAISPYTKNAIADLANINFRFFVNHRENIDTEYTSRLAIFYIIDVIFKTYLVRKEKE